LLNQLKVLRERKQITQAELARTVKVTRQALSAIEASKQAPSLQVALRIANALDIPLHHIFFMEDDSMDTERASAGMLTKVERLSLSNQYKILQVLNKDDEHLAKHYERLADIFQRGYVVLYREAFGQIDDEFALSASDKVLEILEMHRAMLWSLGETPDPKDVEKVKFRGFDANGESEYLSFAKFFISDGETYRELHIFNSHMPTLPRYQKMLDEWTRMGKNPRLTKPQIESILEAGSFKH